MKPVKNGSNKNKRQWTYFNQNNNLGLTSGRILKDIKVLVFPSVQDRPKTGATLSYGL